MRCAAQPSRMGKRNDARVAGFRGRARSRCRQFFAGGSTMRVVAPSALVMTVAVLATGAAPAARAEERNFEIYGFAMADWIQDTKRVDPNWQDAFRPSRARSDSSQRQVSPAPRGSRRAFSALLACCRRSWARTAWQLSMMMPAPIGRWDGYCAAPDSSQSDSNRRKPSSPIPRGPLLAACW